MCYKCHKCNDSSHNHNVQLSEEKTIVGCVERCAPHSVSTLSSVTTICPCHPSQCQYVARIKIFSGKNNRKEERIGIDLSVFGLVFGIYIFNYKRWWNEYFDCTHTIMFCAYFPIAPNLMMLDKPPLAPWWPDCLYQKRQNIHGGEDCGNVDVKKLRTNACNTFQKNPDFPP